MSEGANDINTGHDGRDQILDYVNFWNEWAEIPAKQIVAWLSLLVDEYPRKAYQVSSVSS